ncbi:hypothetical protein K431DRAFT_288930 [Polychaeton citri CBS 116435]|uniref:Uncharacterized protein n=1 Tax=Polychaeton citri CBS 116435 TaxID=1314669 RepID=A0A9P4UK18_9PEZI|nr:hypothetical protein K431DRAFT_288930 [Polychaeton citri CBS 116435]
MSYLSKIIRTIGACQGTFLEMSSKALYLLSCRQAASQRAHFALVIVNDAYPGSGTRVEVVGAPMVGFQLEVDRNYDPSHDESTHTSYLLGAMAAQDVDKVLQLASTVPPPRISQDFMAPVDGVCHSWQAILLVMIAKPDVVIGQE